MENIPTPEKKSQKSLMILLNELNLNITDLISSYDIKKNMPDIAEKLAYQRNKAKNPTIKPVVKFYSQNDTYLKYPYYYYKIEEFNKFIKEINEKD